MTAPPGGETELVVAIDPVSIEALAEAVTRHLAAASGPPTARLLQTRELAAALGRTPGWVRSHASELGAIRLGEGPKPRLLFELEVARERLASCSAPRESSGSQTGMQKPSSRRGTRRAMGTSAELLPVSPPRGVKTSRHEPPKGEHR